jgi:hypothetical protein
VVSLNGFLPSMGRAARADKNAGRLGINLPHVLAEAV